MPRCGAGRGVSAHEHPHPSLLIRADVGRPASESELHGPWAFLEFDLHSHREAALESQAKDSSARSADRGAWDR